MKLGVVSRLLLLSLSPLAVAAEESYVDFLATSERTNVNNTDQHYVVRIVDPDAIATARAELEKPDGYQIVAGTINTTAVEWNPGWSYHVVPGSVEFGDIYTEVCDANVEFVQENLQDPDLGGAFLPDYFWCPWGSRILAELEPETEVPGPTPTPTNVAGQQTSSCGRRRGSDILSAAISSLFLGSTQNYFSLWGGSAPGKMYFTAVILQLITEINNWIDRLSL